MRRALTRQFSTFPVELRRTLTWDQGKEMAEHAQFTIDTHIAVFFLRPAQSLARQLNNRLRQALGRMKPSEVFNQLVASTG